jgi:hypothetical protein
MYVRDGLLDAHVGPEFLERLQVNGREPMEFWTMAAHLGVLLQQVASVSLLWVTYTTLGLMMPADPVGHVRAVLCGLTVLLVLLRYIATSSIGTSTTSTCTSASTSTSTSTHTAEEDHPASMTIGHSIGYLVVLAAVAPAIINMTTTISTTAVHRLVRHSFLSSFLLGTVVIVIGIVLLIVPNTHILWVWTHPSYAPNDDDVPKS